jgi:hypothetical protein
MVFEVGDHPCQATPEGLPSTPNSSLPFFKKEEGARVSRVGFPFRFRGFFVFFTTTLKLLEVFEKQSG